MKFGARSPSRKRDELWIRAGYQMVQDQGGLVSFGLRTRPFKAFLWVVLLLVTTTLLLLVLAIVDTMSLKDRVGLTLNRPPLWPPLQWQWRNMQNQAENSIAEVGQVASRNRHFESQPNWNSIPAKTLNVNLLIQQQQDSHDQEQQELENIERNRNDDGIGSGGSRNRDIKDMSQKNDFPQFDHDSPGMGDQVSSVLRNSNLAGRVKLDHDEGHVRNEALDQVNSSTATTAHEENSAVSPTSKPSIPELSIVFDGAQGRRVGWLQFPETSTDCNETEQLMVPIRQNGTIPCHHVRTKTAQILGLHQSSSQVKRKGKTQAKGVIRLEAGPVYELVILSIGDDDQPRCAGGDYYETDLSGPRWKSRPPVVDRNNGTYSLHLQMDPRFAGKYTLTVVLLFANFHALHFHPQRYARMEDIATFEIEFFVPGNTRSGSFSSEGSSNSSRSSTSAPAAALDPELPICRKEDFDKKYWSGRWTRENFNKDCEYDKYGRWKCVDTELECQKPWCDGSVGSLESNGWVYSAHCAFKIFQKEEAWKCLDGKWLFFWGDSNHIDTIRNLLNFVLGFNHKIKFLDRKMDMTFSSPPDNRSSVRITSMFNGHSNVSLNYEGLFSLHNSEFAAELRSYFTGETAPDLMIMNSGLHDGLYWRDMNAFLKDGVGFASEFWSDVWSKMTARRPHVFYRTTIATGGQSRNMSFNPHKMELFNHLIVDRFVSMKLERFQIIDGFDYTFPWHWDHKTNDGVHYGRPPSKTKWTGNNLGHRYFVDLMLVHMLLNAICTT